MCRTHGVEGRRPDGVPDGEAQLDGRVSAEATVSALRSALHAHVRTQAPASALVRVLRTVTAEARRDRIPIAELLIAIKTTWSSMPETRQARRTGLRDDMLDAIVSLCIVEYYSTGVEP